MDGDASRAVARIAEFPTDGRLWLVRAAGPYSLPSGRSAARTVDVTLVALPDESVGRPPRTADDLSVVLADGGQVTARCTVGVGLMPRLAVGSLYRDGVACGFWEGAAKTFVLSPKVNSAGRAATFKAGKETGCPLIGCDSADGDVWIPCSEVFRSFYGFATRVANAITSGPWDTAWPKLAVPKPTGIRVEDGHYQIIMRRGMRGDYAAMLGQLIVDKYGRDCAHDVYRQFLPGQGPGDQAGGPRHLSLRIPFAVPRLRIRGHAVPIDGHRDRWLLTRITGFAWPYPRRQTLWRLTNDGSTGESQVPVDAPQPYSSMTPPSRGEEDIVEVNSEDDPAVGVAEHFEAPASFWLVRPKAHRLYKPDSGVYRAPEYPSFPIPKPADGTSPGPEGWTGSDRQPGRFDLPAPEADRRFEQLVRVLDRLQADGHIQTWCARAPDPFESFRGGRPVWLLPSHIRLPHEQPRRSVWAIIDRDTGQRRSALICRIEHPAGSLLWLELETRGSEGFRALLLRPGDLGDRPLRTLLQEAVNCRGIWGEPDKLCDRVGADAIEAWRHVYRRQRGGAGGEATEEGRELDGNSALRAIERLLGL